MIHRSELTDYEWYRGNLTWMLRPHGQTWIHDFVVNCGLVPDTVDPIVVNAHRRLGKSFLNVLMGVEDCLRGPGVIVRYICGEKTQVEEIVEPLLHQILATCPEDLMPKKRGFMYRFQNPAWGVPGYSDFKLAGANYKNGDMARGTACDRAYLDEVRDFKKLRYFVESVLAYQFVGRRAPRLVMTSTVPWTLDHDFTRPGDGYLPQAMQSGRYKEVKASQNPDYTARDKNIVLSLCPGGERSHSYRREAECELVGDPERLIVPEYEEVRDQVLVEEYKRPLRFIPRVVMDTAFDPDQTAILFGYLDFTPQILVIEDEVVERRMTTQRIAEVIRKKEAELGYDKQNFKCQRCGDLDERAMEDLRREHKLGFLPVSKFNKQAALARLRGTIAEDRIRIYRRCGNLDYQLRYGIWNENGTDYQRSENLGHWDAGKALVYLNRHLNWQHNPGAANALRGPLNPYDGGVDNYNWRNAILSALHRRRTQWT